MGLELSAHEHLLDLSEGGVFGEPFSLARVFGAESLVDVGIGYGEELLFLRVSQIPRKGGSCR